MLQQVRFPDGRTAAVLENGVGSANQGYAVDLELALIPTGFDNTVIAIRLGD